jgi:predicted lipoprotein
LSELVNQWIGGLERLRWGNMEMPARVAQTGYIEIPDFPRSTSGASAASWAAQWDALRSLATGPVSLASALRERDNGAVADRFVHAVGLADAGMISLSATDTSRIFAAAKELAALKRLVENEVAPALGINVGFSDADGD